MDLSLADGENVDSWTIRLVELLKRLGAGPRTFFKVYPSGWKEGMPYRRVEVSGEDRWVGEQGAGAPAKPKARAVKKSPGKKRG